MRTVAALVILVVLTVLVGTPVFSPAGEIHAASKKDPRPSSGDSGPEAS